MQGLSYEQVGCNDVSNCRLRITRLFKVIEHDFRSISIQDVRN
jgi:hypothetical protein